MYDLVLQWKRVTESGVPDLLAMGEQARLAAIWQHALWTVVFLVATLVLVSWLRGLARTKRLDFDHPGHFFGTIGAVFGAGVAVAILGALVVRLTQPIYYNLQYAIQVLGVLR